MAQADPAARLRQAVLVASELEPVAALLQEGLGLADPFRDPGVAEFGLANVVFAIGDCFLEVVSPTRPGTAAGRQLERAGGDGGYMALFDLEDLEGARRRAELGGVRTVWRIDLPDISGTHMHPGDQQHRAAPFAADSDPLDKADDRQDDSAPDANGFVGRHKAHRERRQSGRQEGRE